MAAVPQTSLSNSPKIPTWDDHSPASRIVLKAREIFSQSLHSLWVNAPSLMDRIVEFNASLSLSDNFAHLIDGFDPELSLRDAAIKLAEDGCFDLVQEMLPKVRLAEEDRVLICLLAAKHFYYHEKTTLCGLWDVVASLQPENPAEIKRFYRSLLEHSIGCNWTSFRIFYTHYNETYGPKSFFPLDQRVQLSLQATKDQHCEIGPLLINPQEAEKLSANDRVLLAVTAIQDHSEFSRSLLSDDLVDDFYKSFVHLSLKSFSGIWYGIRDGHLCWQQACSLFASFHRWDLIRNLLHELESPLSKSCIVDWAQKWLQSPVEKTQEDIQQAQQIC